MSDLGCERKSISADEVIRIEPALASIRHKQVGGDFTDTDESGDVYKFTTALAAKAAAAGVDFQFNTRVTRLLKEGSGADAKISDIEIITPEGRHQILHADAFVIALGSFSVQLLKTLGIDLLSSEEQTTEIT